MTNSHTPPILNREPYMAARIQHQPRTYRPRSCFNADGFPKSSYESKEEAMSKMKELHGPKWRREGLNVYRCPTCREWHVGHSGRKGL